MAQGRDVDRPHSPPAPAPEQRLRLLVHGIALAVGLTVAIAIPLGHFAISFADEARALQFMARLTASRVATFARAEGESWRDGRSRLSELLVNPESPEERMRQYVRDASGGLVLAQGHSGGAPTLRERAPVVVAGEQIGWIEAEASLRPMLIRTGGAAALGLMLALAAYLSVYALPLRALSRVLGELANARAGLERQVAETQQAYAELERHHRAAEEAAQGLARALHTAEEAERHAAAASRTKSEFLANMSHELRTPLNAVIGFSDILLQQMFGPLGHGRYLDYARDINECGAHLLQLVNEILDLSKIEASKLDLHLEPIDAVRVMTGCARLMGARAREAGLAMRLEMPDDETLPPLRADETKFKQIVLNLLSNAIKFTPEGGTVTLSVARDGDARVLLTVADTGIGMSEDEVREALKPFRQVDNSHTRKHQGTGLGLPLAKALTELHGGAFSIASAPARGTIVTLSMPAEPLPHGLIALVAASDAA